VQKLETLLDQEADDRELLLQVISYYHETLKESPEALRYLERRGLRDEVAIEHFVWVRPTGRWIAGCRRS
jgi:DNA primase